MAWKDIDDRRKYHREYERRRYKAKPRTDRDIARMVHLTDVRKQIIMFCNEFTGRFGWSPSFAEIQQYCRIATRGTVLNNVRFLHEAGWITCLGNRQIKVLMLP